MGGLNLSDFSDQESGAIFQGLDILDEFYLEHVAEEHRSPEHPRSSTPLQSDESNPLDFDSPLEVARAGPVAIPVLSSHHFASIRADVGSPCRNLPPSPVLSAPVEQETTSVKLASLESPTGQPASLSIATPSRATALPPADLVQRGAKTLKASTTKHAPPPPAVDTKKAAALKSAIRGQLDSAVLARINPGAPKSVSGSHTTSSARVVSENSVIEATEKPKQTLPPLQPRPEPRLVKKPHPISRPTIPLSSSVNRTIPRPALASKTALPRPKSTLPSKTTSMLPPPSSIPLKRPASSQTHATRHPTAIPLSVTRPSHAHPAATFGKPLLGQPARVFREAATPLEITPVFSVAAGGDHSTMSMSRIALKSPAKQNMYKKPLGENHTPRKVRIHYFILWHLVIGLIFGMEARDANEVWDAEVWDAEVWDSATGARDVPALALHGCWLCRSGPYSLISLRPSAHHRPPNQHRAAAQRNRAPRTRTSG